MILERPSLAGSLLGDRGVGREISDEPPDFPEGEPAAVEIQEIEPVIPLEIRLEGLRVIPEEGREA
jgi:hypothetical protein